MKGCWDRKARQILEVCATTTFEQGNLKIDGGRDNIHCTAGEQSSSKTCKLSESVNHLCMRYATIRYKDDLRLETLGIARGCSSAQVLPPRDDLCNPAQLRADTLAEGNLTLKENERNFERVFQRRKELRQGEPACQLPQISQMLSNFFAPTLKDFPTQPVIKFHSKPDP